MARPSDSERGLGATIAVMMLAMGALYMSIAAEAAALSYADSVDAEVARIQRTFDLQACADSAALIKAKDAFASGDLYISDFDCHVSL